MLLSDVHELLGIEWPVFRRIVRLIENCVSSRFHFVRSRILEPDCSVGGCIAEEYTSGGVGGVELVESYARLLDSHMTTEYAEM